MVSHESTTFCFTDMLAANKDATNPNVILAILKSTTKAWGISVLRQGNNQSSIWGTRGIVLEVFDHDSLFRVDRTGPFRGTSSTSQNFCRRSSLNNRKAWLEMSWVVGESESVKLPASTHLNSISKVVGDPARPDRRPNIPSGPLASLELSDVMRNMTSLHVQRSSVRTADGGV